MDGRSLIRAASILVAVVATALAVAGCSAPPAIPKEKPLSAAEKQRQLRSDQQTDLAELQAEFPDVKPGHVTVNHFVHPRDWASTMHQCMLEAGFQTKVEGGGVTYSNLPSEQLEAYNVAFYRCSREYPIDPMDSAPLSGDELKYLYGYRSGALTRCLLRHGISVATPPSEQTFADSYPVTGGWDPYSGATNVSRSQREKLVKACPPSPPGFRGN